VSANGGREVKLKWNVNKIETNFVPLCQFLNPLKEGN
jgi:hypothetical protein